MKRLLCLLALFTAVAPAHRAAAQDRSELTMPPNGNNQKAEISQWIGLVKVTISYHSPREHFQGTTDRTGHIWGELVLFDFFDDGFGPSKATPWRAGANENTTITFSHDIKIEGKDLKAGTYALFLVVEKTGPWTWIFSTHTNGWGSFQYDPKHDALRVPVATQDAPFTEFLTYAFDGRLPNSATAYLQWENKRVPFKIDVPNVNELYVAQMRQDLLSWPGFSYQNWMRAAQFAGRNGINLEEALEWANKAITEPFRGTGPGREEYATLATKGGILRAMGRHAEADSAMDRAIRYPDAPVPNLYQYGMSVLQRGLKEKAMEVFKFNKQQHPDEKFWTYLGLARGYTAAADKKNAIANWEIALKNVPPQVAPQVPGFEQALKALREGR